MYLFANIVFACFFSNNNSLNLSLLEEYRNDCFSCQVGYINICKILF